MGIDNITSADKIHCLKRELAMRRRAYPKWISRGQLTQEIADREIEVMEAILKDYIMKVYMK